MDEELENNEEKRKRRFACYHYSDFTFCSTS